MRFLRFARNDVLAVIDMKLALHICCAPDATTAFERLSSQWQLQGLFYNPNLYPLSEYNRREAEARYLSRMWGIAYNEGERDPEPWLRALEGFIEEPEGGERCRRCIAHRLEWTAEWSVRNGFDAFATTLTTSPHKNVVFIHEAGVQLEAQFGVRYLPETLRKANGFQRSLELCRLYGLYRQNYCGCFWSLPGIRERYRKNISLSGSKAALINR